VLAQRRASRRGHGPILAAVAAGGVIGALTRYGASLWLPHAPGAFPWATFTINVSGCLLIGVLMVLISEVWSAHPLLQPFLGTGVMGGYTTFSAYAVDARGLLGARHPGVGFVYLGGTLTCALVAVYAGVLIARWATGSRRSSDRRRR
jgi:CrcB protein